MKCEQTLESFLPARQRVTLPTALDTDVLKNEGDLRFTAAVLKLCCALEWPSSPVKTGGLEILTVPRNQT